MKVSKRKAAATERKTSILNHLARMPFGLKAADIQKGIGMKRGNIYNILERMEKAGQIKKNPDSKKYLIDENTRRAVMIANASVSKPRLKEQNEVPTFKPNPLIVTIQKEIAFIDDGIDSLRITKSYLFRRIEQLKAEDLKRARSY